ncbi:Uncharacterized protein SCG7109_AF_00130 [Chlamydiales bacterium SCGC AG-110-M15]|nr:Uncharacterized protein SCG7109_AF_00130 [Chlamydiales bacterium SCGC AG-110-M15]
MSRGKKIKCEGSNFDDFLEEEGLLEECDAVAAKRVFVYKLEQELKKNKMNKSDLARRMNTSRSAVQRLLDPTKPSTFGTLSHAARVFGKHLELNMV